METFDVGIGFERLKVPDLSVSKAPRPPREAGPAGE
jgi:hypothetical protein